MKISECIWDENSVDVLWRRHQVTPDEVEEAIFGMDGEAAIYLIRRDADNYQIFGETGDGRLLSMVGEPFPDGRIRIFHAMDMTPSQRRAFRKGK